MDTPHGPARVQLEQPAGDGGPGLLLLGHGAGGGVEAPDLLAARDAALAAGLHVGRVEQPYRVAGRKSAAPAHQLDAAWEAVCAAVRTGSLADLPLIAGGRSSGARVACRTAGAVGAAGVLCLAFPLQPPMRRNKSEPPPSRIDELEGVGVPVLIVQGERDQFGMPPEAPGRTVVRQPGTHALKGDIPGVRAAVEGWLADLLQIDVEIARSGST